MYLITVICKKTVIDKTLKPLNISTTNKNSSKTKNTLNNDITMAVKTAKYMKNQQHS